MKPLKVVLSEEQIQKRVKELGKIISADYQGKQPVVICMLKGAIVFFSDIVRNLTIPISMEFARLSSYRNGTVSGEMEVVNDITADISGKDILIIEDVVDSGKTLSYFIKLLKKKNPASVKICAFLDKPERRCAQIDVDYVGFRIECGFVIGYGLDYAERFRELPYLAEINSPKDLED
ncbi:MAG: hypoxanthine phosphoribosyltransferase [Clostridia bacterium]|nr:hypoxanthine phosphoribosyltransferase [Clostridia bacterium]